MLNRLYIERQPEFASSSLALTLDIQTVLNIASLDKIRIINYYDLENASVELITSCLWTVFAEPQTDMIHSELPSDYTYAFAVEYLPGQYDQRADAATQCMTLIAEHEPPLLRTGHAYLIYGDITDQDLTAIKKYLVNPVESHEVSLDAPSTLALAMPEPEDIPILQGFSSEQNLQAIRQKYGLAMDLDDLQCCQAYFSAEQREPSWAELKVLDTYWSDHCRHTTFLTEIDTITFEDPMVQASYEQYLSIRQELDRKKPITLMDIATIGMRYLQQQGLLNKLDDSAEINACTVKIEVRTAKTIQPWLLLFKNETHNHPTEIEPFGGAATCIGGAIRDPLSGRGYVYQAMRLTGAANPHQAIKDTIPGKLPQRKLTTTAAAGYSSYGNQIGLATGLIHEFYHPGYMAKRMEVGAVIAAVPADRVRREEPTPGDVVILLGGKTGRDGCGGATGSSLAHTAQSLETCGAEVQKGNAPEERKIQRFFRQAKVLSLIKRCNDFGAGGVSVAIGELANGLKIDLDAVPKKYAGLDGTELAISESQERMAVVVAEHDAQQFIELAQTENLSATIVAQVIAEPRLIMVWRKQCIVDLARDFIDSHGAKKHIQVKVKAGQPLSIDKVTDFVAAYTTLVSDLNICSQRGLIERFDSTVGANTVLMPLGGLRQATPTQVMVAKIPVEQGDTTTVSLMSYGFDPMISSSSPFIGAYTAVIASVAKLIAAGASLADSYLSLQEYFAKPGQNPERWGQPTAALLGALKAQLDLGIAAIGGKDSMSGSFEQLDVPPTLISFAVTTAEITEIISPEFKQSGSRVVLLQVANKDNIYDATELKQLFQNVHNLIQKKLVVSAYIPEQGGIAETIFKMSLGNGLGFKFTDMNLDKLFNRCSTAFVLELADHASEIGELLGHTQVEPVFQYQQEQINLYDLELLYNKTLENIFPTKTLIPEQALEEFEFKTTTKIYPTIKTRVPQVLIPVFPGTNCEYESVKAVETAGAKAQVIVIKTSSAQDMTDSIKNFADLLAKSAILFIPGGFSNGDEPDGSGKFITAFLRNPLIAMEITKLLEVRQGLILGICNGFQALIKLGLVPYGKIIEPQATAPTLTYNLIGRHQSRLVQTKICSNLSPWFAKTEPGTIITVPISHGEGRFVCDPALFADLAAKGQIVSRYVDFTGKPSLHPDFNPAGSYMAVEGICSPDGRVLGKMGHSERIGKGLYKNVPGLTEMQLFESAVEYFK